MVNVNIDLTKLRTLPLRLKVMVGVIVVNVVFLACSYLALDSLMEERVAQIDQRKTALSQLRKQESDLKKQVDEYPSLRQRYESAIAAGLTVPLDRLALVQATQDSATSHHLAEFHYKLAPDAAKAESSQRFRTEIDRIILDNGGLLDTDVLSFWNEILSRAGGHYRVAELSLDRIGEIDAAVLANIRRGAPASTFKAHFDLQWTGLQAIAKETTP